MDTLVARWARLENGKVTLHGESYPRVSRIQDLYEVNLVHTHSIHRVNPNSHNDQLHVLAAVEEALWSRQWEWRIDSGYIYEHSTPHVAFINPLMDTSAPTTLGN